MPRDDSIRTILVLGSGPIVIGQACEFDYSGSQAVKALLGEGYRVVLVNSNPATIMTDPELAAGLPGELRTYIEPLILSVMDRILEVERPDALLPTVGGQTAINLTIEMDESGLLERHGVRVLGAGLESLRLAEDRLRFKRAMEEIGLEVPRSGLAGSIEEALDLAEDVGYPVIVRPSFTLAGMGSGLALDEEELAEVMRRGLELSPARRCLVEESVLGWKEFELEVMRDRRDQCVVVCSIENLDAMGVHTGDSVTVAPAMTLTDREYQNLRDQAFRVIRRVGVATGGSNIQFAVHPETRRVVVIEMNPRVSRSSALASKATGFPIAKIAARLAVGYTLDEIANDITRKTPASFEPALDYVVVKMPRWNLEKFPGASSRLGTQMRSVGEVMAIGRTFKEAFLKASRSLEMATSGDVAAARRRTETMDDTTLWERLAEPSPDRLRLVQEALERGPARGFSASEIARQTQIDPWFLHQLVEIAAVEEEIRRQKLDSISRDQLRAAKQTGISDRRLAQLLDSSEEKIRETRETLGLHPVYCRVDTCAGEFVSHTPYLYSTWEGECEAEPTKRQKVLILGGGPIRIGQGIEFDYCACHAAFALREAGVESSLQNCNPETVSTDYDTADRLYFEPVTLEDVLAVARREGPRGVIVQFGGQTPLNLARGLSETGLTVLGTPVESIELAEDRERFGALLAELGIARPEMATAQTPADALAVARTIGYPVIVRPSWVLGGRAMQVIYDDEALAAYAAEALQTSPGVPLFLDRFLEDAFEVDVDAVSDGTSVLVAGVQQHIEEAGIHSGDSAAVLPPYKVSAAHQREMRAVTARLARALGVRGLLNIQFAIKDGIIYVLEANPRASRTIPWVSKATGMPLVQLATRVILGEPLASLVPSDRLEPAEGEDREVRPTLPPGRVFVKMPVFSANRFPEVDTVLGPEMRSTGEVLGIGPTFGDAFAKAAAGTGLQLPLAGTAFLSVHDRDKPELVPLALDLLELGFSLLATRGTKDFLAAHGIDAGFVYKVNEGHPNTADRIAAGEVRLVINTPLGRASFYDEKALRGAALAHGVPCITTLSGSRAVVDAIRALREGSWGVEALQDLHADAGRTVEAAVNRKAP